jgi:hypothetical protein
MRLLEGGFSKAGWKDRKSGGAWAARTPDHLIKSQMLYQLS